MQSGPSQAELLIDTVANISNQENVIRSGKAQMEWTGAELFVIASLQLLLVFIAYRLDRAPHPMMISESVCAMSLGILVRIRSELMKR